jgi:glycosyltransferase involved in cell wall biosynthesis
MKKVRVFVDVYYFKAALSGIKTYIHEFNQASIKYGSKDIEYLFSHDLEKFKNNLIFINSKNRLVRWLFQFNYFIWKQIILPLKLIYFKADYLICPDYIAPKLTFKTKKIIVIHDSLFWDYPKNYSSLWRKYFLFLLELGINNKTKIVTTSNYSKTNLKDRLKTITTINYVYQSSEKSQIFNKKTISSLRLPKSYILHIGSFEERKDLLTLVKAFCDLKKNQSNKNLKLILAGAVTVNGNKKVYNKIKSFIDNNNLDSDVIFPNFISNEDLSIYYKNALVYVFPSIDEGFGIPIIESFSYSTPVVCSNIPVFKEIGNDAVVYFEKGNFISLSEKIQELINSKELREKFVAKGEVQLKNFSRKKFIEGFENIIYNWDEK